MKIIHVVAGLWKDTGGPAEVIPQLCLALSNKGCDVSLVTVDGAHSGATLECGRKGVDLVSFKALSTGGIRYIPDLGKYLKKEVKNCDIVHNHGHWLHSNWSAYYWSKYYKKPLVTTPHGTLVPGMLERSRLKKAVAWNLVDKHLIKYSKIIHALSNKEKLAMEPKVGNEAQKIEVIPNGVNAWSLPDSNKMHEQFPETKNKKIILFLSRVHEIKGICDLLNAWENQYTDFPNWHLLVVGSVDNSSKKFIQAVKSNSKFSKAVTFTGPMYGDSRLAAYAIADTFVLPSYGEGLPTVLLEALASSLPLVYTHECNFQDAVEIGAGIVYPAGISGLEVSLKKMLTLSDQDRFHMGKRGLELVRSHYSWGSIADQWIELYRRVVNGK